MTRKKKGPETRISSWVHIHERRERGEAMVLSGTGGEDVVLQRYGTAVGEDDMAWLQQ
jgi:hypothetical protein